jgi:CRP-like cAMP-binding protein
MEMVYGLSEPQEFAAGETLYTEGETGDSSYLIVQGEANLLVGGEVHWSLGPGDFFGDLALIDSGPRVATVVAVTPLNTLAIASKDFQCLLEQNPDMTRKLLAVLAGRIRTSMKLADPLRTARK